MWNLDTKIMINQELDIENQLFWKNIFKILVEEIYKLCNVLIEGICFAYFEFPKRVFS
jgi:hypothetical protein